MVVYNGVGDGVTDNTAMFNAAVAAMPSTTRTLLIPPGKYRFASPPAPLTSAINLIGEGKAVSWLMKDYSGLGGYFLKLTGGQDSYGGGSIQDLSIYASPGSTDGIAIWVLAHPDADPTVLGLNPHGLLVDNIQIGRWSTQGGAWAYGIYLDGSLNSGPGALGIRAVAVRNTSIAAHTAFPMYLNMAYGTRMTNVDAYAGPTVIGQTNSSNTTLLSGTCTLG